MAGKKILHRIGYLINYMVLITIFHPSILYAKTEVTYSRQGDLPSIRTTVQELDNFTKDLSKFISKVNASDQGSIKFEIAQDGVLIEGASLKEIVLNHDIPDPFHRLTIIFSGFKKSKGQIVDYGPLKNFGISLAGVGEDNIYVIKGTDKVSVEAIEGSIIKFADEHRVWPSHGMIPKLGGIILGTSFVLLYFATQAKSTKSRTISASLGLVLFFLYLCVLFFHNSIFPTSQIFHEKPTNFIRKYSSEIAFWGTSITILLTIIGLVVNHYYRRNPVKTQ